MRKKISGKKILSALIVICMLLSTLSAALVTSAAGSDNDMVQITVKTGGSTGRLYQELAVEPGAEYELQAYIYNSKPKDGTEFYLWAADCYEWGAAAITLSNKTVDEDTDLCTATFKPTQNKVRVGLSTDWIFNLPGAKTYIYNFKLCKKGTTENLLNNPNSASSWTKEQNGTVTFDVTNTPYDNRFEPNNKMVQITVKTGGSTGGLYQELAVEPGAEYELQAYIYNSNPKDGTEFYLWAADCYEWGAAAITLSNKTVDEDTNLCTATFTPTQNKVRVGLTTAWIFNLPGAKTYIYNFKLCKKGTTENLLNNPNNASSWVKSENSPATFDVSNDTPFNGFFGTNTDNMVQITIEAGGSTGRLYQDLAVEPGAEYELQAYIYNSNPKDGTEFYLWAADCYEWGVAALTLSNKTVDEDTDLCTATFTPTQNKVRVGLSTAWIFNLPGAKTYIYNFKLCKKGTTENLLNNPNNASSWTKEQNGTVIFDVSNTPYDNRFEPNNKMVQLTVKTGGSTGRLYQELAVEPDDEYELQAYIYNSNPKDGTEFYLWAADCYSWGAASLTLSNKTVDEDTNLCTATFKPTQNKVRVGLSTDWIFNLPGAKTYIYNFKLCKKGTTENLLNNPNNASSWTKEQNGTVTFDVSNTTRNGYFSEMYISSSGNDGNDGTQGSPVATVAAAYNLAKDLDIVTFKIDGDVSWGDVSGNYDGLKAIFKPINPESSVSITGNGALASDAVFKNVDVTGTMDAGNHSVVLNNGDFSKIVTSSALNLNGATVGEVNITGTGNVSIGYLSGNIGTVTQDNNTLSCFQLLLDSKVKNSVIDIDANEKYILNLPAMHAEDGTTFNVAATDTKGVFETYSGEDYNFGFGKTKYVCYAISEDGYTVYYSGAKTDYKLKIADSGTYTLYVGGEANIEAVGVKGWYLGGYGDNLTTFLPKPKDSTGAWNDDGNGTITMEKGPYVHYADYIQATKTATIDLSEVGHFTDKNKAFAGWYTDANRTVAADSSVSLNKGDKLYAKYVDDVFTNGNSEVKLKTTGEAEGLRFVTTITTANLNSLGINNYNGNDVSFGTKISVFDDDESQPIDIKAANTVQDDVNVTFTALVKGLTGINLSKKLIATPYVNYVDANGIEQTVYGKSQTTSIAATAAKAVQQGTVSGDKKTALQKIVDTVRTAMEAPTEYFYGSANSDESEYKQGKVVYNTASGTAVVEIHLDGLSDNKKTEIAFVTDTHMDNRPIGYTDWDKNPLNKNPGEANYDVNDPDVTNVYYNRAWPQRSSLKPAEYSFDLAALYDGFAATGDLIDFCSINSLEKLKDIALNPYPFGLYALGNHDRVKNFQTGLADLPQNFKNQEDIVKSYIGKVNDIYYESKLINGNVLLIQMDNGTGTYSPEVAAKLEADIAKARNEGLKIVIAQHIPLNTNNPSDTAVESLDGGSPLNFYNGYIGDNKNSATTSVYNLITSSADVIKAIVCGHEHIRYYSEVQATTQNGDAAVIPQYIIRSAAYTAKSYGSKYSDYGCVTKIVFDGVKDDVPTVTLPEDTTIDNSKVAPVDWWLKSATVPEISLGTYLRNNGKGVRFSFQMDGLNGISVDKNNKRVMENATISLNGVEYDLVDFGAIVSINSNSPMTDGAEGVKTLSATKLNGIENGKATFSFAVPFIPTDEKQTFVRMRPYVTIDDGNGKTKILYGDVVQDNFDTCELRCKPNENTVTWESIQASYTRNDYEDCIEYNTPLTNTYNKLTKDKELTVVYFGGSLTAGYGCTNADTDSWRAKSGNWLKTNFPDAKITTINATAGESGTLLGSYRVQRDVIAKNPDLLFIEYAINDYYSGATREVAAMRFETIVREVRTALPNCDIVTVLTTDNTQLSKSIKGELFDQAQGHYDIAHAYGLPIINVGTGLAKNIAKIENNENWWSDSTLWAKYFLATDGVHANTLGQNQYYLVVEEFLENSLKNSQYSTKLIDRRMPPVQSEHLFDGNRQSYGGVAMKEFFDEENSDPSVEFSDNMFIYGTSQITHQGYYSVPAQKNISFNFSGTDFSVWINLGYAAGRTLTYSVDNGAKTGTINFASHQPMLVVDGLSSGEHTITLNANLDINIGYLFTRDSTMATTKGTISEFYAEEKDGIDIQDSSNNIYLFNELGDVDGDGAVNLLDLVRLKKHLADMHHDCDCGETADIDGNGAIEALDLVELRKILLSK